MFTSLCSHLFTMIDREIKDLFNNVKKLLNLKTLNQFKKILKINKEYKTFKNLNVGYI